MRIATWNVNGLRARLEFLLRWLADRRPDAVALQELKLAGDRFPHAELEAAGYAAVVHGQPGWNGVAILSRGPARVTQVGLPGQEPAGARLITAEVGGLSLTSVYCPNGKGTAHPDFPLKLAWLDALATHLGRIGAGATALVAGDLNLCPAALDTWDEARLHGTLFHTDDERRRFQALLELGLHDLFRERHPELRAFSWWDYRAGAFHRGQGLRIDFLLGSAAVRARVREVQIDRDFRKKKDGAIPSDHAPVLADLEPVAHPGPAPSGHTPGAG